MQREDKADGVIGVLPVEHPHECVPGRYPDPHGGWLYANQAPEGSVWKCGDCGALWVHHGGFDRWVWRINFKDALRWVPATKRETKAVEQGEWLTDSGRHSQ